MQTFLFGLFFAYTPLANQTLRMWNCQTIGGRRYLLADYQITCDTAEYQAYVSWAWVSTAVYIIGIPCVFLALVYRHRNRHVEQYLQLVFKPSSSNARLTAAEALRRYAARFAAFLGNLADSMLFEQSKVLNLQTMYSSSEATTQALALEQQLVIEAAQHDCAALHILPSKKAADTVHGFLCRDNLQSYHGRAVVGFLYAAFSHRFWWYEVVYIGRKLFLNGLVVFFAVEPQLVVSLLFCFLSVCLQLAVDPYKHRSDNVVQAVIVVQLFLTLFAGMLTLGIWNQLDENSNRVFGTFQVTAVRDGWRRLKGRLHT